MSLEQRFNRAWQKDSVWLKPLIPLSWVFGRLANTRRCRLQAKYQGKPFAAPVIVIGNISVGGSGKTPLIVALVEALRAEGYQPGVVSRGYGGQARYPLLVTAQNNAGDAGDEPLLIARRCQCPVVVDPDRRRAVQHLLANSSCDVVLSDDGLQHYRLHRDIELVVVDGSRGFGNARLLPAGPLREYTARLDEVDMVITNGCGKLPDSFAMQIVPEKLIHLASGEQVVPAQWSLARDVHAVAAIGNPQRFATTLEALGFNVELHPHDDHQPLSAQDLQFSDQRSVIITEKDAVKLAAPCAENIWCLTVSAELGAGLIERVLMCLDAVKAESGSDKDKARQFV